MSLDLKIINGLIFFAGKFTTGDIGIKNGKISHLTSPKDLGDAEKTIDATGLTIIPGVIDAHVHLRDLNLDYKEDYLTGSRAAAAGGITTVLEMPNSDPRANSVEVLQKKKERASKISLVNMGFHAALPENVDDLQDFLKEGIVGLKIYPDDEINYFTLRDEKKILNFFQYVQDLPLITCFHAEEPQLKLREQQYLAKGVDPANAFLKAHDPNAEARIIERISRLASKTRARIHFCHVSTLPSIVSLRKNKTSQISCEITPHHLLLSEEKVFRYGAVAKMLPPLRPSSHLEALWSGIKEKIIDIFATDHAPHSQTEKNRDFTSAPSGIVGLETFLPLCLTLVNERKIPFETFIQMVTEAPARIFGLKNKGTIEVGKDADLTLINMSLTGKIDPSQFQSKAKFTPFEGSPFQGKPVITIVNGKVIMENNQINDKLKPGTIVNSTF